VLAQLSPGTVIDGELVAIRQRDDQPIQDFAAVQRALLRGDEQTAGRLRFVAFDLLKIGAMYVPSQTWRERDRLLRSSMPTSSAVRLIESQAATEATHQAIVALGFEGTVLKRPRSTYRVGGQAAWRKHKARHLADGVLVGIHTDHDGRPGQSATSTANGASPA
jgi:ATP-dependent DNA ligase